MKYDCLFIGNAIVDILTDVSFEYMHDQGIEPGSWRPVEKEEIKKLQSAITNITVASGGSAANSAVGLSFLGGSSAFIGRVKNDNLGLDYIKDMDDAGVKFSSNPSKSGLDTGRCLVYVTPDAQRSMRTYLGAASQLSPNEIDEDTIINSSIVYLEGYLWDEELAKSSCKKALELAKKNSVQTALSLSDSFCVTKWHNEILELSKNVDILFGNEEEFKALFKTDILSDAISAARSQLKLSIITRGHNGSIVISDSQTDEIVAYPPDKLVDTTGAGDLYAAGFLFGLSKKMRYNECANLGSFLSSKVISNFGPRTDRAIRELAISRGLLT
tara:strand:+ start:957 stop:1943 length:987 start_codon:yes stop_codon:yes gene_type:complete